jgi:hypothetical protein
VHTYLRGERADLHKVIIGAREERLANAKRFLEKYSLIAIVEEVVKRCAHSLWEKLRT